MEFNTSKEFNFSVPSSHSPNENKSTEFFKLAEAVTILMRQGTSDERGSANLNERAFTQVSKSDLPKNLANLSETISKSEQSDSELNEIYYELIDMTNEIHKKTPRGEKIAPVRLDIASPSQIRAEVYKTKPYKTHEDDIWALGILLYEIETHKKPPFTEEEFIKPFEKLLRQRDELHIELMKLEPGIRREIFKWDGKKELAIPESSLKLAKEYKDIQTKVQAKHQEYEKLVQTFLQTHEMVHERGQLLMEMLALNPQYRITSENARLFFRPEEAYDDEYISGSEFDEESTPLEYNTANVDDILQPSTNQVPYIARPPSLNILEILCPGTIEEAIGVEDLLMSGADLFGWRGFKGETLLHIAIVKHLDSYLLEELLKLGMNPNIQDSSGDTPLHIAAQTMDFGKYEILMSYGADPHIKNSTQITPEAILESHLMYLDENKLLQAPKTDRGRLSPFHIEWYKNQAMMLEFLKKPTVSNEAKKILSFLSVNAFGKAANIYQRSANNIEYQISPLFAQSVNYHRSEPTQFLDKARFQVHRDLIESKKITCNDQVFLVDSPLFSEVIARQFTTEGKVHEIETDQDIIDFLSQTLPNEIEKRPFMGLPSLAVDFTKWMEKEGNTLDKFAMLWTKTQLELINSNVLKPEATDVVLPFTYMNHENLDVLVHPKIRNVGWAVRDIIPTLQSKNGFLPSPDKTKMILSKNESRESVFSSQGIFSSSLKTKGQIHQVYKNMAELTQTEAFKNFKQLGEDREAPPYAQILSKGTAKLLEGFIDKNLEEAYKREGLLELLQVGYFKIANSIGNALQNQDNIVQFLNEIEVIHQEMQNMLAILSIRNGYGPEVFSHAALSKLTVIPKELDIKPLVHIKPSAMRAIASVFGGVEAMKEGNEQVKVVVLKDCYYETCDIIKSSKNYKCSILDGDEFDRTPKFLDTIKGPVDLFVCEFNHNISLNRNEYHTENIAGQILGMHQRNLLADKCTVMIDTTMELENSQEVRDLLNNPEIQELIRKGKLNIVLVRSGQKFDMLGLDNYYGGIAITLNDGKSFLPFNERMSNPKDQLWGLSYQGMTHLMLHAGNTQDEYRQGIMKNTKFLYERLPKNMISKIGNKNPIQISQNNNDHSVFIDIKIEDKDLASIFRSAFTNLAKKYHAPFNARPSFGFAMANIITIVKSNATRFNLGLEGSKDPKTLKQARGLKALAEIFGETQKLIQQVGGIEKLEKIEGLKELVHIFRNIDKELSQIDSNTQEEAFKRIQKEFNKINLEGSLNELEEFKPVFEEIAFHIDQAEQIIEEIESTPQTLVGIEAFIQIFSDIQNVIDATLQGKMMNQHSKKLLLQNLHKLGQSANQQG